MPTKIQSVDISKSVWPVLQTYKHLLASPSIQYIYGGGGILCPQNPVYTQGTYRGGGGGQGYQSLRFYSSPQPYIIMK